MTAAVFAVTSGQRVATSIRDIRDQGRDPTENGGGSSIDRGWLSRLGVEANFDTNADAPVSMARNSMSSSPEEVRMTMPRSLYRSRSSRANPRP